MGLIVALKFALVVRGKQGFGASFVTEVRQLGRKLRP
jgi:hypothetical protein